MKERYIEMRNKNIIDWQLIYDYAVSKGFNLGAEKFNIGANYLLPRIHSILDQLDCEYELTLLVNKNNEFIKVIT